MSCIHFLKTISAWNVISFNESPFWAEFPPYDTFHHTTHHAIPNTILFHTSCHAPYHTAYHALSHTIRYHTFRYYEYVHSYPWHAPACVSFQNDRRISHPALRHVRILYIYMMCTLKIITFLL